MEFAKGRYVVETGIGAGIRDHHQSVPYQHSAAIGHSRSSELVRRRKLLANFARASNPIRAFLPDCSAIWRWNCGYRANAQFTTRADKTGRRFDVRSKADK